MSTPTVSELFDMTGRTAVVTGGAGFLGRQHARALAEAGCRVALWDIDATSLDAAKEELTRDFPEQIDGYDVDITDKTSVDASRERLAQQFGGLNVLVNNAGITVARGKEKFKNYFAAFESYPIELWEMALAVNLTGSFVVTQSLSTLLKQRPGKASIINIASDVGVISPDHRIYRANPERGYRGADFNTPLSYAASKAALIHMTKYWATYWAGDGIRVNAVSPAGVENQQDSAFKRELVERIPLGRMARPHELKGAIVFLASDASSFVTGSNLIVDGGRTVW